MAYNGDFDMQKPTWTEVATNGVPHTVWYEQGQNNNLNTMYFDGETVVNLSQIASDSGVPGADATINGVVGWGDLALSSTGTPGIVWHENTSGRFLKSTRVGQMDGISDLAVFDMDGDQDLDMVASTSTVDRVVWFENTDGKADFAEGQTIQSNIRNVRAVDSTDINGDGLADIVLASYAHDVVAWFRQSPKPQPLVARKARAASDESASLPQDTSSQQHDDDVEAKTRIKATDVAFALQQDPVLKDNSKSIEIKTHTDSTKLQFRLRRPQLKRLAAYLDDSISNRTNEI